MRGLEGPLREEPGTKAGEAFLGVMSSNRGHSHTSRGSLVARAGTSPSLMSRFGGGM